MALLNTLQSQSQRIDRRRNPKGNQNYSITRMWEHHHEILRFVLLGKKNVEIAAIVGCTPQTVSNVRNSPEAKRQLAIMTNARDYSSVDVAQRIQETLPEAVNTLEAAMGPEAEWPVRRQAAKDLLEMGGFKAAQRIEAVHAHLTSEDVKELVERGRSLGIVTQREAEEAEVLEEKKGEE